MKKDKSVIPKGVYCYTRNQDGSIKRCPYWSIDKTKPEEMNGYCSYLEQKDEDLPFSCSLLWDAVKECRINEENT